MVSTNLGEIYKNKLFVKVLSLSFVEQILWIYSKIKVTQKFSVYGEQAVTAYPFSKKQFCFDLVFD